MGGQVEQGTSNVEGMYCQRFLVLQGYVSPVIDWVGHLSHIRMEECSDSNIYFNMKGTQKVILRYSKFLVRHSIFAVSTGFKFLFEHLCGLSPLLLTGLVPQNGNAGDLGWTAQGVGQTSLGIFDLAGARLLLELFIDFVGHPDPACPDGVTETL